MSQVADSVASLCLGSSNMTSGRDLTVTAATTINNYYGVPLDREEVQKEIAVWLSQSPNYHAIQKETYEKVAPGTGQWFLRSPIFENWVSKESGILWGTGILIPGEIAGAGKTYLASIIVNHLTELVVSGSSKESSSKPDVVAFVYCRYDDKLSSAQILASILSQLVEDNREVAKHVEANLYDPCTRKRTQPTQTEIFTELKRVLPFFSRVFVVIDALDELGDDVCHEAFRSLVSFDQHLLMTSRGIPLQSFSGPTFTIRAPNTDFRIFIEHEFGRFPKLLSLLEKNVKIRQEITDEIERKSDGMFLLAALQLATLKSITTIKSLRSTVAKLPATLNDMYRVTLNRINEQSEEEATLALRAILWVTHATQPLRVEEFLIAVSIDPDLYDPLDPEAIPNESTVLAVCCGLVTFGQDDRAVRLVHFTAHDFFATYKSGIPKTPHAYAAEVCAAYMQDWHAHGYREGFRGFHDYAYSNLGKHLSELSPQTREDIPSCARQFLQTEKRVFYPARIADDRYTDFSQDLSYIFPSADLDFVSDFGSASHFGALYGILPLIDVSTEGLSSTSRIGYTPLDLACIGGHQSVMTHILNYLSENISEQSEPQLRPWSNHTTRLASQAGYDMLVRFLLGQPGVKVNATGYGRDTALHWASERGHTGIVELLLESPGIDVNSITDFWESPLHLAVKAGHDRVVELLLKSPDIDVNYSNSVVKTALHVASEKGNSGIVRMLLDFPGIDVNDGIDPELCISTPLELAAQEYEFLFQKNDKYPNLTDLLAKREKYKEIIELLLERGAICPPREHWGTDYPVTSSLFSSSLISL